MSLQQQVVQRLMYTAENVDGWAADAQLDLDSETALSSLYVHGYIDIPHVAAEAIMAFIRWADASPATTWAGDSGLKERLQHPELFRADGTKIRA